MQAVFHLPRSQHPGKKVSADADGFKLGTQRVRGNSAIRTGHHSHLLTAKRRHHATQVIRSDKDVTVIDQDVLVAGVRQHLHHVAGFAVVAQHLRAEHQPDLAGRELAHELMDGLYGRIVGLVDAKDNFVFGIILDAMAAKALIHLRVNTTQGLENGNRRSKFGVRLTAVLEKGADTPQAKHIKAHAAQGQHRCHQTAYEANHEWKKTNLLIVCYARNQAYLGAINAL